MRGLMRRAVVVAGAAVVLLGPAVGVASAAGGAAGTRLAAGARAVSGSGWGRAKEVPGTAALNQGGSAQINSVSCASAGNCGAGGFYTDSSSHSQAFVVSETDGTWGTAEEVPGTATLNQGGSAQVSSVSCGSAGNCAAIGVYTDSSSHSQAFVVSETNGTWGTAVEIPGTAALNKGGGVLASSVSCPSAGNCAAGGSYSDRKGRSQAFVVNETDGTWGTAEEVPGTATLNKGGVAQLNSVSCPSAGNCAAGGVYSDSSGSQQALVVNETNGTWGKAKEAPGSGALNAGTAAAIFSVSCGSAGNCSAGGGYSDASGNVQALLDTETNGTWGKSVEVPGTAALNKGTLAQVQSVSCGAVGNCSLVGFYDASSGSGEGFVADQKNGIWGTAVEFPGIAALEGSKGGGYAQSVSCASAGNCSAAGGYSDSSGSEEVFVGTEKNGTWGQAKEVPGIATPNKGGNAQITWVSCASAGNCSAGGFYADASLHDQAFVVNQT
jgi:hypothetical protein